MSWRVHLTNQAIPRLAILAGKSTLVAAWTQRNRIAYLDLETGVPMGERTLEDAATDSRQDVRWQEFVSGLTAPNSAVLPQVATRLGELYLTGDGGIQLYHAGGAKLILVTGGKETMLDTGTASRLLAVGMDRFLGLLAVLDEQGRLHLFQQDQSVGVFDPGLHLHDDLPCRVAIPQGGAVLYVSDGQQIVALGADGQVRRRFLTHYGIGHLICSPNGRFLATCDIDTNVLRLYTTPELLATHQRHAVDLMIRATQVQLIADLPPLKAGVSALAMNNQGVLVFAMSGVICMSDLTAMDVLPRPQKLV